MKRTFYVCFFLFSLTLVSSINDDHFNNMVSTLSASGNLHYSLTMRSQQQVEDNCPGCTGITEYDPVMDAIMFKTLTNDNINTDFSLLSSGDIWIQYESYFDLDWAMGGAQIGNFKFVRPRKDSLGSGDPSVDIRAFDFLGRGAYVCTDNINCPAALPTIRCYDCSPDGGSTFLADPRDSENWQPGGDTAGGRDGGYTISDHVASSSSPFLYIPGRWIRETYHFNPDTGRLRVWMSDENTDTTLLIADVDNPNLGFNINPNQAHGIDGINFNVDASSGNPDPKLTHWHKNLIVGHNIDSSEQAALLAGRPGSSQVPCLFDSNCSDGDLCNGVETCVGGFCSSGTAVVTDDGVSCTIDSCDPGTGAVSHVADDSLCVSSNNSCLTNERCDVSVGCVFDYSNSSCDDGNVCTSGDFCSLGNCSGVFNNDSCDDGDACTIGDVCSAGVCSSGSLITSCVDGDGCCPGGCDENSDADCIGICGDRVAHYSFDSDASDGSGGGHDGVLNGPVSSSGNFGGAFDFDGVDDRIEVSSFNLAGDEMSISLWAFSDGYGSYDRFISKAVGSAEQDHYFMLSNDGGRFRFRLKAGGSTSTLRGEGLQAGVWQHLVGVYDGSEMKVFIDGVLVGSTSKSGDIDSGDVAVWIGMNPNLVDAFDGRIDEVLILDRALSDSEVLDLFGSGAVSCGSGSFHEADLDTSGRIEFGEANAYIGLWLSGSKSISDLLAVVNLWRWG